MDARRPMPRSMEWTDKDSMDERFASSSKPKTGAPPSYAGDSRGPYRPYEPSAAPTREEPYTSSTGYSAAPMPSTTYAMTGRTRLAPRGFQTESYEEKLRSVSPPTSTSKVLADPSMFPSRASHRTPPNPPSSEPLGRHDTYAEYKSGTNDHRTSSKLQEPQHGQSDMYSEYKSVRRPSASKQVEYDNQPSSKGMAASSEQHQASRYRQPPPVPHSYAGTSSTTSTPYASPMKEYTDYTAATPRSYLTTESAPPPLSHKTMIGSTTQDLHLLVEQAFASIDDTRAQHSVLFDLSASPLRYNVEVADRAVKAMDHMVRTLTAARDRLQQLSHVETSAHYTSSPSYDSGTTGRHVIKADTAEHACNDPSQSEATIATDRYSVPRPACVDMPDVLRNPYEALTTTTPSQSPSRSSKSYKSKNGLDMDTNHNEYATSFGSTLRDNPSGRFPDESSLSRKPKDDDGLSYHRARLLSTDTSIHDAAASVSYIPTKVVPPPSGGRSMFAEFDRKMKEIRDSLNAIASREALTLPPTSYLPQEPATSSSAKPIKTESFDEYFNAFKTDLAKFTASPLRGKHNTPSPSPDKASVNDQHNKCDLDGRHTTP